MKKVAEECIFSVVLWLPRTYFLEVHPGHLWQKADSNYLQIFMIVRHTKLIIHFTNWGKYTKIHEKLNRRNYAHKGVPLVPFSCRTDDMYFKKICYIGYLPWASPVEWVDWKIRDVIPHLLSFSYSQKHQWGWGVNLNCHSSRTSLVVLQL